jgi:V-type H+-transporting ATPase subunit d
MGSYVEGIVRGYRNGLLTGSAYNNLTQCETIDGTFVAAS